jgi:hypothetical protein
LEDSTGPSARKALEDEGYQLLNDKGWYRLLKDGEEISGSHEPQYLADKMLGQGWRDSLKREKLFHLDELQSNRHQFGQQHGYKLQDIKSELENLKEEESKLYNQLKKIEGSGDFEQHDNLTKQIRKIQEPIRKKTKAIDTTPALESWEAPFKDDNWKNLGLRIARSC